MTKQYKIFPFQRRQFYLILFDFFFFFFFFLIKNMDCANMHPRYNGHSKLENDEMLI